MYHRGPWMVSSLILALGGFIFVVLSFSSEYWWVTMNPTQNHFHRAGMWRFCWNHYVYPRDYRAKFYEGCWYVFAKQFWWIRELILPPWFIACQALEILVILCSGISMMITLFTFWRQFNLAHAFRRTKWALGFKVVELVSQILVLIIFAERATGDWTWVPTRMENHFGWSYGFAVVAAFFAASNLIPIVGYYKEIEEQIDDLVGKEYDLYLQGRY